MRNNNEGFNNSSLKIRNRGLIFKLIATGQCTSRIELAKMSGLTKMSVTNIVSEFMASGLVEEIDIETKMNVGRNPISLDISRKAPKIIGLLVGRDSCSAVLCDFKLRVLKQLHTDLGQCNREKLIDKIFSLIDKMLEYEPNVVGIGVCSIGPVDIHNGIILNPPNFYGIKNVPIVSILTEKYHLPASLEGQYNCAALAEKYYGNCMEYHDFIFLGITNGVGSGIIVNDQILSNAHGLGSEIGHISVDYKGNQCVCGNRGCLETYIGIKVMNAKLAKITGICNSFENYCKQYKDAGVDEVLTDMAEKMACALTTAVNMLHCQAIVIGDQGNYIPKKYTQLLEELINESKISDKGLKTVVVKPYFKENAQLVGSAVCFINKVFQSDVLANIMPFK